jgi:hypothetical protein
MTDPSHGHVQSPDDLLENGSIVGAWNLDPQQSRVEFAVKHFWRMWAKRRRKRSFCAPTSPLTGTCSG